jgi:hypothetical protein
MPVESRDPRHLYTETACKVKMLPISLKPAFVESFFIHAEGLETER